MALHCGVLLTTLHLGPSILSGRKELAKWDEMDIAHCWAMVLQQGVAVELHKTMAMLFYAMFSTTSSRTHPRGAFFCWAVEVLVPVTFCPLWKVRVRLCNFLEISDDCVSVCVGS